MCWTVFKLRDIVLLIQLNKAVYDCYSFIFNWLETDKNSAAFKLLKSRRLNSIFSMDNQIELIVIKGVEPGFFKWFVFRRHFLLELFSTLHPLQGTDRILVGKELRISLRTILPWIKNIKIELEVWEVPVEERCFLVLVSICLEFLQLNSGFFKDLAWNQHFHFIVQPVVNCCVGHTPLNNLPEGALIWLSFLHRLLVAERVNNGWSLFRFVSSMLMVHSAALWCVYFTLSLQR